MSLYQSSLTRSNHIYYMYIYMYMFIKIQDTRCLDVNIWL